MGEGQKGPVQRLWELTRREPWPLFNSLVPLPLLPMSVFLSQPCPCQCPQAAQDVSGVTDPVTELHTVPPANRDRGSRVLRAALRMQDGAQRGEGTSLGTMRGSSWAWWPNPAWATQASWVCPSPRRQGKGVSKAPTRWAAPSQPHREGAATAQGDPDPCRPPPHGDPLPPWAGLSWPRPPRKAPPTLAISTYMGHPHPLESTQRTWPGHAHSD